MKRCASLFLVMVLSLSLWAAGTKEEGNQFVAFAGGWLGSVKLDTLFDMSEMARLKENVGVMEDMAGLFDANQRLKLEVAEVTSSVVVGIESKGMLSEKWGVGSKVSLVIPHRISHEVTITAGNQNHLKKFPRNSDDFTYLLGFELFSGAVFMPIRTSRWGLTLMHGLHMGFVSANTTSMYSTQMVLGTGTEISADVYFGKHFYLNGGIVLTYDFLSSFQLTVATANSVVKHSNIGATGYFSIQPKIAVGYRW